MKKPMMMLRCAVLAIATTCLTTVSLPAQFFINEIYFDPPGGLDAEDEFIELRGEPGASLANHYLIFLESEDNEEAGGIDNIFDLGGFSFGSNGFLTLLQNDSAFQSHPDSTSLQNMGPPLPPFGASPGFGNGEDSTIGASNDAGDGIIENGAFSALLVRNDSGAPPDLSDDLDMDNDGQLDDASGKPGWMILDSVGEAEPGENNVKFYSAVNFNFSGNTGATVSGDGVIAEVDFELEYLGRWGNSVGQTVDDWHAANLTDSNNSGYQGRGDYRLSSGDPQPDGSGDITIPPDPLAPGVEVESNKDVSYGLPLASTVGSPNFVTGDFNRDGIVDAADYAVWRDTLGDASTEIEWAPADHDRNFVVDSADYMLWRDNYAAPNGGQLLTPGGLANGGVVVPEPHAGACLLALTVGVTGVRRRRSF